MAKILLADDHTIVRRGLRQIILEKYPLAFIDEVSNGETLLKKIISEDWDIVISDIVMPGRSGLDILDQVKKIKPKLPILIISIHSEQLYALRVLKAGAAGYLKKDMAPEELIKAIQTLMSGKRYITPSVAEWLTDFVTTDQNRELHELLSDREFEVFKFIAAGKSITEIGERMSLSPSTVSTYRSRVLLKMNLKTNADLTMYATKKNLL